MAFGPVGSPGAQGWNPFYHLANMLGRNRREADERARGENFAAGLQANQHAHERGMQDAQHKHERKTFTDMMGQTDFKKVEFGVGGKNGVSFRGTRQQPAASNSPVLLPGQLPTKGSDNRGLVPNSSLKNKTPVGGGPIPKPTPPAKKTAPKPRPPKP